MAKTVVNALAQLVSFALVYWNRANNERSTTEYGTPEELNKLEASLALRGWVTQYPALVLPIGDEERKQCLAERQARWDSLKEASASSSDAAAEKSVFESVFVKNGKLIEPQYTGNSGFRRASVYFAALIRRFKNPEIPGDEKIPESITNVPVMLRSYGSEVDRIIDQQMENELKNIGTKSLSDHDKLRTAAKLFGLGSRQVHFRRLFSSDTTGQKLFAICTANNNWPQLKIIPRFYLGANESDHIPFGKVRQADLTKLNNRFEAQWKRDHKEPLTDKEKAYEAVKPDEVDAYFRELRTGSGGNDPKIMKKADIEGIAKQSSINLFRIAASSILAANSSGMAKYLEFSQQLNLHKELIDTSFAVEAEAALNLVKQSPDMVRALVEVCKTNDPATVVKLLKPTPAPAPVSPVQVAQKAVASAPQKPSNEVAVAAGASK